MWAFMAQNLQYLQAHCPHDRSFRKTAGPTSPSLFSLSTSISPLCFLSRSLFPPSRSLCSPDLTLSFPFAFSVTGGPLMSEEETNYKVSRTFAWKPRPESGLDCRMCAMFARRVGERCAARGKGRRRSIRVSAPLPPRTKTRRQDPGSA